MDLLNVVDLETIEELSNIDFVELIQNEVKEYCNIFKDIKVDVEIKNSIIEQSKFDASTVDVVIDLGSTVYLFKYMPSNPHKSQRMTFKKISFYELDLINEMRSL